MHAWKRCLIVAGSLVVAGLGPSTASAGQRGPAISDAHLAAPAAARTAIVGGTVAKGSAFPSLAAVLVAPSLVDGATAASERISCGGALIAPTIVLTAAHCVIDEETGAVDPALAAQVVIGRSDLRAGGGEVVDVVKAAAHPRYHPQARTFEYDVALLLLAHPSAALTLPLADTRSALSEAQRAMVVGWGTTHEGTASHPARASPILRTAQIPLWSSRRCVGAYRYWDPGEPLPNPALMLCAAARAGGRDTCQGDSGGPLLVRDQAGMLRAVGIVSFAIGCARRGIPTVFTWAASPFLRGWILRRATGMIAGDVDATAPELSGLRIEGGIVSYAASESTEVVFSLGRLHGRRLTLLDTALVQRIPAGDSSFRLPRSLAGHRLPAGHYVLSAVATDGAGNLSRTAKLTLTLR